MNLIFKKNKPNNNPMKKSLIILGITLALLLVVGCERYFEDPINPPVETIKYTVKATADHGRFTPESTKVSLGGSISLELILDPGYESDSIYVNDIHFPHLSGKTSFTFSNIDGDFNVKSVTKINNWGILMNGPWEKTRWQSRLVNESIWLVDVFPPALYAQTVTYTPERKITVNSEGIIEGNSEYKFEGDTISLLKGEKFRIVVLNDTTLITEDLAPYTAPGNVIDPTRDRIIRITYSR